MQCKASPACMSRGGAGLDFLAGTDFNLHGGGCPGAACAGSACNGTLVYRDKKQEICTVKPDYVTGHRWAADWHCYCRLEQAGGHRQAGVA